MRRTKRIYIYKTQTQSTAYICISKLNSPGSPTGCPVKLFEQYTACFFPKNHCRHSLGLSIGSDPFTVGTSDAAPPF